VRQAKVPMFEAPNLSRGIVHNVCVCYVAVELERTNKRSSTNKINPFKLSN
jgi:hypothetical protein